MTDRRRLKYLDLLRIRQPVPAVVSILHRISGAALFLFAGVLLYLFQASLQSPESYVRFRDLADAWWMKLFLIGMLWALLHHFLAGIRFLLLDIHVFGDLRQARATSWAVLAASLMLTAALGALLW
ncbi:MAG TPA: succinate dehydrogenase, cytochrome b556 subunit [Burkholderiales bacterium]|jgi:succinate dehydrogenase / fumarate reductase cytochrome b subunit|nr:succinate dehydrogenase, cytochrome b556 subunit [Burkholderiales bacterium]